MDLFICLFSWGLWRLSLSLQKTRNWSMKKQQRQENFPLNRRKPFFSDDSVGSPPARLCEREHFRCDTEHLRRMRTVLLHYRGSCVNKSRSRTRRGATSLLDEVMRICWHPVAENELHRLLDQSSKRNTRGLTLKMGMIPRLVVKLTIQNKAAKSLSCLQLETKSVLEWEKAAEWRPLLSRNVFKCRGSRGNSLKVGFLRYLKNILVC